MTDKTDLPDLEWKEFTVGSGRPDDVGEHDTVYITGVDNSPRHLPAGRHEIFGPVCACDVMWDAINGDFVTLLGYALAPEQEDAAQDEVVVGAQTEADHAAEAYLDKVYDGKADISVLPNGVRVFVANMPDDLTGGIRVKHVADAPDPAGMSVSEFMDMLRG